MSLEKDNSFILCDINMNNWEFEEVSIESFKERLYRFAENGDDIKNRCNTTEELWKYFREQFPI